MHRILAETSRQLARVDEARLNPCTRRGLGNARQSVFRGVERQQLASSRKQRLAHRMRAIEQRDVARGSRSVAALFREIFLREFGLRPCGRIGRPSA